MAQHQYLFHLVKSLTPSEKRYFRLHGKSYFQNEKDKLLYEKLFNAIDKLPDANITDADFIKANKNAPFIANLGYLKNYLYEQLTQALRQLYSDKNSPDYHLPLLMTELRMFAEMGLVKHATATAVKIISLSEMVEAFHYTALASNLISQAVTYQARQKNKHLRDIEQKAVQAAQAAYAQEQCLASIRILTNDTSLTPAQQNALIKQINTLKNQYPHLISIVNTAALGLSHYYIEKEDFRAAMKVIRACISTVEESSLFHSKYFWTMQSGMGSYIVQLHNLSYCAFCIADTATTLQVIEKLNPIRQKAEGQSPPLPKADLFLFETKSRLQYALMKNKAYNHSEVLAIEREIKRHKPYLPSHYLLPFYYLLATYCLIGKKSSVARKYCMEALAVINSDNEFPVSKFEFEILLFLVLCRENETDLISYKIRNLKRTYGKHIGFRKNVVEILSNMVAGKNTTSLHRATIKNTTSAWQKVLLQCIAG